MAGTNKPGHDERKTRWLEHQYTRPCANGWRTLQWRKGAFTMTLKSEFRRSTMFAAALVLAATALTVSGASPARADRCDDLAAQLKSQIDGLAVGKTAANLIYLSHPQATEITLGCRGRNVTNQIFAKANSRKTTPACLDLVASSAAVIFSLPCGDMRDGA